MKKIIKRISGIRFWKGFPLKNFSIPNIVYVLFIGFVVRVILSGFGTLPLDHGTFVAWSLNLAGDGLSRFYNSWSDYLPGYLYVLWLLGKINLTGAVPIHLLYKLPAVLADVLTSYFIYKTLGGKKGIIGACVYLFNPAVFANSALWGQVDGFIGLFSMMVIYFLNRNLLVSAVSLSVGAMIKPQTAFLVPLVFLVMIKNKWRIKNILIYGMVSLAVAVLLFIPFSNSSNLIEFIFSRLALSANQYPYTAVNAFNFWGLFGQWKADNLYFQFGGYLAFLVTFLILAKRQWKQKDFIFQMFAYTFAFSFLFFTRMHERHLLPLFAPLAALAAISRVYLIPYAGLSFVYLANLYYSYKWITEDFLAAFDPFPVIVFGLGSFLLLITTFFDEERIGKAVKSIAGFFSKSRRFVPDKFAGINISMNKSRVVLTVILVFAFATRAINLGVPKEDYFDEIYHAFTARLVLHADPKAWEWWNPHPEGFAYEWTHPPFSKLAMAGGMLVFGESPFGWRFPQAVAGVLGVYLVYLVTKFLFKDEALSLTASLVYSLDGLPLTLSRMGMNDGYVVLFMLASIYFFLREKDFQSALFLGLAISSKWSAVWAVPILFLLWLRRKNKIKLTTFIFFLIIPVMVYVASYWQMFATGHDLGTWWGMQKQMWWYHTNLDATHPYTSAWWSWPLNLRPVYLYTSDEVGGMVGRIYAMGNPIVFWFGFFSVTAAALYAYFEKNKNLGFLVFSYLVFFVPWAASPRIMFLYHYLPSIPFMCMAIAYFLRRNAKAAVPFILIALLSFVYFYPHLTGMQIPLWLDKSYYWMSSWR